MFPVFILPLFFLLSLPKIASSNASWQQEIENPSQDPGLVPQWRTWAEWQACSKSCGSGLRRRTRRCLYQGLGCTEGDEMEEEACAEEACPSRFQ